MTHSIDAPLPPPTSTGTGSHSTTESFQSTTEGSQSTTERAKETKNLAVGEAKNVGQTATQAGSQVASVATDQAKEVVHETQRQARDLLDQGRSQLKGQAVSQQRDGLPGQEGPAPPRLPARAGGEGGRPGRPGQLCPPARRICHVAILSRLRRWPAATPHGPGRTLEPWYSHLRAAGCSAWRPATARRPSSASRRGSRPGCGPARNTPS